MTTLAPVSRCAPPGVFIHEDGCSGGLGPAKAGEEVRRRAGMRVNTISTEVVPITHRSGDANLAARVSLPVDRIPISLAFRICRNQVVLSAHKVQ